MKVELKTLSDIYATLDSDNQSFELNLKLRIEAEKWRKEWDKLIPDGIMLTKEQLIEWIEHFFNLEKEDDKGKVNTNE